LPAAEAAPRLAVAARQNRPGPPRRTGSIETRAPGRSRRPADVFFMESP